MCHLSSLISILIMVNDIVWLCVGGGGGRGLITKEWLDFDLITWKSKYFCFCHVPTSTWHTDGTVSSCTLFQQTQNICITFVQCRPNVSDVGPTLYKCDTNVLCFLGCNYFPANKKHVYNIYRTPAHNIYITMTLYKCYTDVVYLLGDSRVYSFWNLYYLLNIFGM